MTDDRDHPMNPNDGNPNDGNPNAGNPDDAELGVDPLDERLSAELDGAAPDPRPDVETGGHARADARRRELAAARDLLAIPPPPLDDITRRRLLRGAVAAATPQRRDRRLMNVVNRVGAAAAVLAIVVLGGLWLDALGDGNTSRDSATRAKRGGASQTSVAAQGPRTDLGEVADAQVLKRRVEAALDAPPAAATTTLAPEKGGSEDTAANLSAIPVPIGRCDAKVRVPSDATPTVLGRATFDRAPAVVLIARDGIRTLVFVVATDDCRLLSSQFFGG